MPSCDKCEMYDAGTCRAHALAKEELKRPLPPPPSGACMIPIIQSYLGLIKPGMKVLEIGCGSWSKIHDHCVKVGASYDAIDTQESYFGVKSVATRIENLNELSFSDKSFDFVIGNQTMEHWEEFGCPIEWGLWQCFRVCKPGGLVLMNVPVHFHGTWHFMMGRLEVLEKEFKRFASHVTFEPWGKETAGLKPYHPFPGYRALENKPAYVLDIRAVRKENLPTFKTPRWLPKGKALRLVNYPLSFNFYRMKMRQRKEFSLQ